MLQARRGSARWSLGDAGLKFFTPFFFRVERCRVARVKYRQCAVELNNVIERYAVAICDYTVEIYVVATCDYVVATYAVATRDYIVEGRSSNANELQ